MLENGKLYLEAHHAWFQIAMLEACLRTVLRKGACHNDDIANDLHNERAYWENAGERDRGYTLSAVIWKNGFFRIYDREKYMRHKHGKKLRSDRRMCNIDCETCGMQVYPGCGGLG